MYIGSYEITEVWNGLRNSFLDKILTSIEPIGEFFNPALNYIVNFFNYIQNVCNWLASYFGLVPEFYYVLFGLIGTTFGVIIATSTIKIVVKWWSALVP